MLHTLGGLFTTTIHTSLRSLFDGSKNQRNPMPKHVELQIISSYINQYPTDVGVRTFLRNLISTEVEEEH